MVEGRDNAGLVVGDDDLGFGDCHVAGVGHLVGPRHRLPNAELWHIAAIRVAGFHPVGVLDDGDGRGGWVAVAGLGRAAVAGDGGRTLVDVGGARRLRAVGRAGTRYDAHTGRRVEQKESRSGGFIQPDLARLEVIIPVA